MSHMTSKGTQIHRAIKLTYVLSLALALAGSAVYSLAQLPKLATPPPKVEPAPPLDPLGRGTPRSSLIGFLKYEASGKYEIAARYLQFPPGQDVNLATLAREIRTLYPSFQGNINLLSDDPNGTVEVIWRRRRPALPGGAPMRPVKA
jgi:hypothetical protein